MSETTKDPQPSTSTNKRNDRLNKLRALELRMNEARKINHKEVVEEDRRAKLPANHETRRRFVEWEEQEETKRTEADVKGENYDRVKLLDIGADDVEKWERKKKKKNPDPGFSDYEAATARQYQRLTKQIKPKAEDYEREKELMGESFYATKDTLGVQQHKDTEEAMERMVTDLDKQINKRSKYSRRRTHDDDADIDYINERNMKYNKKLERFYGKYTTEIRQNLERGTAV